MEDLQQLFLELLTEYNSVTAKPREYPDLIDGIMRTTTAAYVTESTSGFFPDTVQPAFVYLRAAVRLLSASALEDPQERLAMLMSAQADVEKAEWEGVNQHSGKLSRTFINLRGDPDAKSKEDYGAKLFSMYNLAGDLYEACRGNGVPEVENMFTAIAQIALLCSEPKKPPFAAELEEQEEAVPKIRDMVAYAIRQTRIKVTKAAVAAEKEAKAEAQAEAENETH